jgi:hypothetical protein
LQLFAPPAVVEKEGPLVEFGRRSSLPPVGERHRLAWEHRDLWHGALVKIGRRKGYAPGWAAHKYREKFGAFPTLNHVPEREPTVEILNWVKSKQIAFAKSRARG